MSHNEEYEQRRLGAWTWASRVGTRVYLRQDRNGLVDEVELSESDLEVLHELFDLPPATEVVDPFEVMEE